VANPDANADAESANRESVPDDSGASKLDPEPVANDGEIDPVIARPDKEEAVQPDAELPAAEAVPDKGEEQQPSTEAGLVDGGEVPPNSGQEGEP
jgi:hypothetical protein